MTRSNFIFVFAFFMSSFPLSAEDNKYVYPELEVTPLSSDRLHQEMKLEPSQAWTSHIPIQVSALTTLLAGSLISGEKTPNGDEKKKDQKASAAQFAYLVGGGWLGTTVLMSALYRPYRTCYATLPAQKRKDTQSRLARERAAEECIDAPSTMASRLNLLSITTNLIAGAFIAATAEDDFPKIMGGVAGIVAFAPLLFSYHWQDVADYQEDYKKRIYGPITQIGVMQDAKGEKLMPALSLSFNIR